jgi:hypothetical protein
MTPTTINSLRRIRFSQHRADGTLTVYPAVEGGVPLSIRRVFTITGVSQAGIRGDHAHRACSQMVSCLAGGVIITVDDGFETVKETLRNDGMAMLIPPMLWNSLSFAGPSTVLAVFCDELYDVNDYIRSWSEYMRLKTAERLGA